MMGFNLISLSSFGYVVGSVWNFVANICANNLSFLFIDEFTILVETLGPLEAV